MTAIDKVAHALRKSDIPLVADGGIKFSGDIIKALAAGAHTVMIGSIFEGTAESSGQLVLYEGRRYKIYRGIGSLGAMKDCGKDRYFQGHIDEDVKFVPEDIEGRVPYKGHLSESIYQLVGGLRAGMVCTGSASIEALRTKPRFVKITATGLQESHAHDIFITEEAPNYPMNVKS